MESDLKLELKLDTSLHSLAAVAAAIYFWELPEVQGKLQKYFLELPEKHEWKDRINSEWFEIHILVFEKIRSVMLPDRISMEIICLANLIEQKIIRWYEYVMVDLGLNAKFARKIFWTSYAQIDEAKIFREFWQNETDFFSSLEHVNGLGSTLYTIGCLFAQEDFINYKSEQMINEINSHTEATNEKYSIPRIITIWLNFYFKELEKLPLHLLCLRSLSAGFNMAVKFLIENNSFPQQFFTFTAAKCLENISIYNLSKYKKEKCMDIFLFLLNKMQNNVKIEFLLNNIVMLFYAFLQVWPYQMLLLQIVQFIAENFNNQFEIIYPSLVKAILKAKKERTGLTPQLYERTDDNIFMKVFEMGPKHLKMQVLFRSECDFCTYFFDRRDYSLLRFILNDKCLSDCRQFVILKKGHKHFSLHVKKLMFDEINLIMKKLMLTEKEIKKLKMSCNTLSDIHLMAHYIECGLNSKIDKLLTWLSDSESERINLKTGIKSAEICTSIIEGRVERYDAKYKTPLVYFEKLDKYLNWQFNTEEEIVDFKLKLDLIHVYQRLIKLECKSGAFNGALTYELLDWQFGGNEEKMKEIKEKIGADKFICEQICELWHLNYVDRGEEKSGVECLKFLKWFYESGEVILNKREKISHTENFVQIFCDQIKKEKEGRGEMIEKFLKFCNLTEERAIAVIKEAVLNYN